MGTAEINIIIFLVIVGIVAFFVFRKKDKDTQIVPIDHEQWKSDIATIRKWVQFFGWLTIASIIITIIATLSMMK